MTHLWSKRYLSHVKKQLLSWDLVTWEVEKGKLALCFSRENNILQTLITAPESTQESTVIAHMRPDPL